MIRIIIKFGFCLIVVPQLIVAQSAPTAHFDAATTAICDSVLTNNFTDLSTNNPTSWKWYFPGASPDTSTMQNPTNIRYMGYGCYNVKLVVANNNGSDSLIDSNYICLDSPPIITLSGDLRVCTATPNKEETIFAHGGTRYLWMNGDTLSYFTFYGFQDYLSLKVTVYNGACFKDTTFPIKYDTMPVFHFTGDTSICKGSETTLYAKSYRSNSYQYLWSTGSTTDSIVIDGLIAGSFNYYLTITNGSCVFDSSQVTVDVKDCTGIDNLSDFFDFAVYPNPSNGIFNLEISPDSYRDYELGMNTAIEIYNVLGKKIYSRFLIPNSQFLINLSSQPNGIYFYRVIAENGSLMGEGKMVIAR